MTRSYHSTCKREWERFWSCCMLDRTIPLFSPSHAFYVPLSLPALLVFAVITPLLLIVPSLVQNLTIIRNRRPNFGEYLFLHVLCNLASPTRLVTHLTKAVLQMSDFSPHNIIGNTCYFMPNQDWPNVVKDVGLNYTTSVLISRNLKNIFCHT